jgi:hypothetical protein
MSASSPAQSLSLNISGISQKRLGTGTPVRVSDTLSRPLDYKTKNTAPNNLLKTRVFRDFDPQQVLNELLSFSVYDRDRGGFVRTARRSGPQQNQEIGELVGFLHSEGYLQVRLLGFQFQVSHLVWLAEHGSWPQGEDLDHFGQVGTNNHISNLRDTTRAINGKNAQMWSHNTSGYTGVSFDKRRGKYFAYVNVDGKRYYCGYHDTPEAAYAARQALIAAHPEWGFTEGHGL